MRVLLADDHGIVRRGLRSILEDAGHTVVAEAADGLDATRLSEERRPDLLILVNRVMEEYGVERWGNEYGGRLLAWMQTSYVFVNRYDTPVPGQEGLRFIMELYQRK